MRYTEAERREIVRRAYETLARLDRKLPRERGRQFDYGRRQSKQSGLIYKVKYDARR